MEFSDKKCKPCEGGVLPLTKDQSQEMLQKLKNWQLKETNSLLIITKTFKFEDYYQTIAFVNAVAWITHQENHHPQLEIGYNTCTIQYYTHSIKGLSENDFICAAKIDNLLQE